MAGYSLHIGLNLVDPEHYGGWDGALNGCEYDAEAMMLLAEEAGYEVLDKILTKNATKKAVLEAIGSAAAKCQDGDILMVTYSGHGGQLPNPHDRDDFGTDETWCLYDSQLLDDELALAWTAFQSGVRIVVVSDSCHAGGVEKYVSAGGPCDMTTGLAVRQAPARVLQKVFRENRQYYIELQESLRATAAKTDEKSIQDTIQASVILMAACQHFEYSFENAFGGMYTSSLISIWNFGRFNGNYDQFRVQITPQLRVDQNPSNEVFGAHMAGFEQQVPFTIKQP